MYKINTLYLGFGYILFLWHKKYGIYLPKKALFIPSHYEYIIEDQIESWKKEYNLTDNDINYF